MSEGETKLVDTSGDYRYVVRDGTPVDGSRWRSSRILLTNERLILAGTDSKQSIAHENVEVIDDPDAVLPDDVAVDGATPLRVGETVVLVDASGVSDFEREYCRADLDTEIVLVKHPAVVGGVVQDTEWSKARFRFADDTVKLALPGGRVTSFEVEDVGTVDRAEQQVMGEERPVIRVEHTDGDDRSVETHFSGTPHHCDALEHLLRKVIDARTDEDYELTEMENQVLMALYSGVSPFEMSDFVGISADEVEEIYAKLLEMGAVDKVRVRTEVTLNAHGRNLASQAMSEE